MGAKKGLQIQGVVPTHTQVVASPTHSVVSTNGFIQAHGFSRQKCRQLQPIVNRNQFQDIPSDDKMEN